MRHAKDSWGPDSYIYLAFAELKTRADREAHGAVDRADAYFIDALNYQKPHSDIALENIGLLIRFNDPNVPCSGEPVDPRDLATSFGSGVALERASVEITDAPVTTGIEERLPWLDRYVADSHAATSFDRKPDVPLPCAFSPTYFKQR